MKCIAKLKLSCGVFSLLRYALYLVMLCNQTLHLSVLEVYAIDKICRVTYLERVAEELL